MNKHQLINLIQDQERRETMLEWSKDKTDSEVLEELRRSYGSTARRSNTPFLTGTRRNRSIGQYYRRGKVEALV